MNRWNVGDKAILDDGEGSAETARVTVKQIDGLPPGKIVVTIDSTGAFGVVNISQLTPP